MSMVMATMPREMPILKALTIMLDKISTNFGRYTLETTALYFLTIFTLWLMERLKNSQEQ